MSPPLNGSNIQSHRVGKHVIQKGRILQPTSLTCVDSSSNVYHDINPQRSDNQGIIKKVWNYNHWGDLITHYLFTNLLNCEAI